MMSPRSDKHANFRRLAEARTSAVLEALRKLSNLSSPNYEFDEEEVTRIFAEIRRAADEAQESFARLGGRKRFTL